MLAQNFMTPNQLGIDGDLHRALIKVLGQLERSELIHIVPDEGIDDSDTLYPGVSAKGNGFNMNIWAEQYHDCGTVCCIGGWAERYLTKATSTYPNPEALTALFHPYREHPAILDELSYDDITPAQAATALRNYLTRGRPNWEDALSVA